MRSRLLIIILLTFSSQVSAVILTPKIYREYTSEIAGHRIRVAETDLVTEGPAYSIFGPGKQVVLEIGPATVIIPLSLNQLIAVASGLTLAVCFFAFAMRRGKRYPSK